MRTLLALLGCLVLSSCCNPCYNYPLMGACEFVTDSYMIRQGKLAIIQLEGKELQEVTIEDLQEYEDTIVEDDILSIVVYHPTREDLIRSVRFINDTVGGFQVKNGKVDLPDIPPVHLAGLTLEEARYRIRDVFREHIQDVEVFVTYRDRLKRKVELAGLVGVPFIPVDGKMRLYDVISQARISPAANLFMSYILRDNQQLAIDLHRLMNEGDMTQNIVMKGGDKIFIANTGDASVVMMGEIIAPRAVPLPYGFMSLREAIVQAGGIPYTGDRCNIQVIRGNMACPKIYVLNWWHIVSLPNDSLLLMPGDTVYVSEKPITKWNRFISQLLPSVEVYQKGFNAYLISRP